MKLKNLNCHVEWAGRLPTTCPTLPEYNTQIADGFIETWIAVPWAPTPFAIHLFSDGYIAPGLAMFVYIDGVYQCNRNRHDLIIPVEGTKRQQTEIDFYVRQMEQRRGNIGEGIFGGKTWTFGKATEILSSASESDLHPSLDGDYLGTIEVVVLRLHPDPSEFRRSSSEETLRSPESATSTMDSFVDDTSEVPFFTGRMFDGADHPSPPGIRLRGGGSERTSSKYRDLSPDLRPGRSRNSRENVKEESPPRFWFKGSGHGGLSSKSVAFAPKREYGRIRGYRDSNNQESSSRLQVRGGGPRTKLSSQGLPSSAYSPRSSNPSNSYAGTRISGSQKKSSESQTRNEDWTRASKDGIEESQRTATQRTRQSPAYHSPRTPGIFAYGERNMYKSRNTNTTPTQNRDNKSEESRDRSDWNDESWSAKIDEKNGHQQGDDWDNTGNNRNDQGWGNGNDNDSRKNAGWETGNYNGNDDQPDDGNTGNDQTNERNTGHADDNNQNYAWEIGKNQSSGWNTVGSNDNGRSGSWDEDEKDQADRKGSGPKGFVDDRILKASSKAATPANHSTSSPSKGRASRTPSNLTPVPALSTRSKPSNWSSQPSLRKASKEKFVGIPGSWSPPMVLKASEIPASISAFKRQSIRPTSSKQATARPKVDGAPRKRPPPLVDGSKSEGPLRPWTHRLYQPHYLDTHDDPYAVFVFHYRDMAVISEMLEKEITEPREDQRKRFSTLSKSTLLEMLLENTSTAPTESGPPSRESWMTSSASAGYNPDLSAANGKLKEFKNENGTDWDNVNGNKNVDDAWETGTSQAGAAWRNDSNDNASWSVGNDQDVNQNNDPWDADNRGDRNGGWGSSDGGNKSTGGGEDW